MPDDDAGSAETDAEAAPSEASGERCPECDGKGERDGDECPVCGGTGNVMQGLGGG